jgi:hypothetical protein
MTAEFFKNILNQLQKRSKLWFIVWFILIVFVPFFLIQIQASIINGINTGIMSEPTLFSFYANTTNPSISSLYLTSYVHKLSDGGSHLFQNVAVYLIIIILIFLSETFFLLPNESGRSEKDFYYPLLLFFFILPFSISGISLIIFRIIGGTGFNGISGIVAAFIGYFWFILYNVYFSIREDVILKNPQMIRKMDVFFIGCFFIPILIFVYINLLSYDNLGGHTAGYVFGFFSGYGTYLTRKKKEDKIIIALIFAIIIWITSTFWIFF